MTHTDTQLKKKIKAFRCPDYSIKGKSPFCPREVKFVLELIHSAVEEARKEGYELAIDDVAKAYVAQAKEYQKEGLTIIAKLMMDVKGIALDLLSHKKETKKI